MKRKTLAAQIREAKNYLDKKELAKRGRIIAPDRGGLETFTVVYFFVDGIRRLAQKRGPEAKFLKCEELMGLIGENLSLHFMEALKNRDAASLRRVAEIIEELDAEHVDPIRYRILQWKSSWERERKTLRELATRIQYKGNLDRLRKLAKELEVPLAKDKAGRRTLRLIRPVFQPKNLNSPSNSDK